MGSPSFSEIRSQLASQCVSIDDQTPRAGLNPAGGDVQGQPRAQQCRAAGVPGCGFLQHRHKGLHQRPQAGLGHRGDILACPQVHMSTLSHPLPSHQHHLPESLSSFSVSRILLQSNLHVHAIAGRIWTAGLSISMAQAFLTSKTTGFSVLPMVGKKICTATAEGEGKGYMQFSALRPQQSKRKVP